MTIEEQILKEHPKAKIKTRGLVYKKGVGPTLRVYKNEIERDSPTHIFYTDSSDGKVLFVTDMGLNKALRGDIDSNIEVYLSTEGNSYYIFKGDWVNEYSGISGSKGWFELPKSSELDELLDSGDKLSSPMPIWDMYIERPKDEWKKQIEILDKNKIPYRIKIEII